MPSTGAILIVDDNDGDVQLLLRTFQQLEIENPVEVCSSADDAIAYLETHKLPALMLLDLKMPVRDGFYVLEKVKTSPEWKHIIVIVLTTSSDWGDTTIAYQLGANSFLTKPFDLAEFKVMVAAFHQYWLVQNKPAPKEGRVIENPFVAND